jgi:hypothetical protein
VETKAHLCFSKKVRGRCGSVYGTNGAVDRKSLGTAGLDECSVVILKCVANSTDVTSCLGSIRPQDLSVVTGLVHCGQQGHLHEAGNLTGLRHPPLFRPDFRKVPDFPNSLIYVEHLSGFVRFV